jgi:hypothetical protein
LGNEASDWLATEFSAKDKGRMKLNEVNTENNELIQRNN